MIKIVKNLHWSVYVSLTSMLIGLSFAVNLLLEVNPTLYFFYTNLYAVAFFGLVFYLTKPIIPPKNLTIEEQEEYIIDHIESKRDILKANKFNICFFSLLISTIILLANI